MEDGMKPTMISSTALAIVLTLYGVIIWLDYYGRQTNEASSERIRAVELANTTCGKNDWKLSGSGAELVITCVSRISIGEGPKK
jgi:hypothetical protein